MLLIIDIIYIYLYILYILYTSTGATIGHNNNCLESYGLLSVCFTFMASWQKIRYCIYPPQYAFAMVLYTISTKYSELQNHYALVPRIEADANDCAISSKFGQEMTMEPNFYFLQQSATPFAQAYFKNCLTLFSAYFASKYIKFKSSTQLSNFRPPLQSTHLL